MFTEDETPEDRNKLVVADNRTTTTTILWPLYSTTCVAWHPRPSVKNWRILLEQSYIADMPDGNYCIWIRQKTLGVNNLLAAH